MSSTTSPAPRIRASIEADLDLVAFSICIFTCEVSVPEAQFYQIDLGRRGELSYSLTETEERDWEVVFTIDLD